MQAPIKPKPSRIGKTALALTMLLVLAGHGTAALGETIGLFYDPSTPQHVFAAGDIRAALEARKVTVEVKDLKALTGELTGKKIVIALASDPKVAALFAAQGGSAVKSAGEQGGVDKGDYVRLYQILDGGKEKLIGEIKGKPSEPAMIQGTANGKKLVLVIRAKVSSEDEALVIDNLKVTAR
jgi:hypothetical protein